MFSYRIQGAKPLAGRIRVQGSKNAALPVLAATLLTKSACRISNVPRISDVRRMIEILEGVGAKVRWLTADAVEVEAKAVDPAGLRADVVGRLRGSIVIAGALLARCGNVRMPYPGGDLIGPRPVHVHLAAFQALGARVSEGSEMKISSKSRLAGGRVVLTEPSVTGTENALLAASLASRQSEIRLAAMEPHVQALCSVLEQMGVRLEGVGTPFIRLRPCRAPKGFRYRLEPDELEVSAFAVLAAATRSSVTVGPILDERLDSVLAALRAMDVRYRVESGKKERVLRILTHRGPYRAAKLQVGLYPKLGSDHLPPFAVLATQADGTTLLHEWMYEGRLRYIEELQRLGANAAVLDPHRALVVGPTALTGREITSFDIRSGMVLVIAALVAQGQSIIKDIEHLDRGYERLDERLREIGADIERLN